MKRHPSYFSARLERPAWEGYAFAAVLLVVAQGVRFILDPWAGSTVPLATMYVAVVFAVWFGGWKPAAVLALVGYFIGVWLFVQPRYTLKLSGDFGAVRTSLYLVSCTAVIYLCESLRRTRVQHAASETKVLSILENMRESFCAVGPDWKIRAVNRSAEAALGRPRTELEGRSLWEILPGGAGSSLQELQRALRDRSAVQFESNAFVAGAWHSVNVTHVNDELAIFFQDITASRAHVDQLERLVDDRTAALQRMVTELEAFSYTLVHDMRAPLRSITGFAELLSTDHAHALNADGKRFLSRIQRSAATMDRLITDILSYSQLSRSSRPQLRTINLDEMIRDILHAHDHFQPDKADIVVETTLPAVHGSDALLKQCFSNLLHNATKFVAPGTKPRIRISGRVQGEMARIEIADNGIGVAPEATARIFEPFRREHAEYDGTGIGLAIVQKVIDQLDGRVGVESQPGEGSRFWVELKTSGPKATASS